MKLLQLSALCATILFLYGFGCSSGSGEKSLDTSQTPMTGIGGSMAQFTISEGHLYVIKKNKIKTYDISSASAMKEVNEVEVEWGIETLFPYQNNLFVGSQNGMYIYNISAPASPQLVSEYRHIRSCDPVVVNGQYAYVTLRSGNEVCGWNANRLEIVDISDLSNPQYVTEYEMENPHGLGIDEDLLFICDGASGLKIYDNATNPNSLWLKTTFTDLETYDIIPYNDVAMVTGPDGIYQYDYSDPNNLQLLSKIPVVN